MADAVVDERCFVEAENKVAVRFEGWVRCCGDGGQRCSQELEGCSAHLAGHGVTSEDEVERERTTSAMKLSPGIRCSRLAETRARAGQHSCRAVVLS